MAKYKKQSDPKEKPGLLRLACCDCGLVHDVGFDVGNDGMAKLVFKRNGRATAQIRKGLFAYLKTPVKGDKWKMVKVRSC
jgi:hypothetical protein